jgi:hypothetical protein
MPHTDSRKLNNPAASFNHEIASALAFVPSFSWLTCGISCFVLCPRVCEHITEEFQYWERLKYVLE